MRVIDLLNKIANGEEVPSPIYHNNLYYDFEDGDYFNQKTRNWLFNDSDIETILNDKVEVIEEDKKIEKMSDFYEEQINKNGTMSEPFNKHELKIISKVNEIIDYINKEKE